MFFLGDPGIAPFFLKFNFWSPGAGFIPIISTKKINQIKKGNGKKKNKSIVTLVEMDDRKDIKIIHSFGAITRLILY